MIHMRMRHRTNRPFSQLAEELEPMPEVGNQYIGAEIMLPRKDKMARGHVVVHSCNTSGNVMGRAHANPIMDTRLYQVEFVGGKVLEFTTIVIAESIYAQFDKERNEYLLLDVLVVYHKDNKAISLTDQQITVWGRPVTYDHCRLANLLPVEGWFYLMGEIV